MANDFFPLVLEAMQAFDPYYRSGMQEANEAAGMQGHDWGILFYAVGTEPQALSPARLHALGPYISASGVEAPLTEAASRGFLAREKDGSYRLTEAGRHAFYRSFEAVHEQLASIEPLPAEKMNRITDLLYQAIETLHVSPKPADKSHFLCSRRTDPGFSAPAATRIDQYLTDLARFRDDAHQAAWQSYEITGPAWEILTVIWRDEANSREALGQRLERRNHDADTLTTSLQDLKDRGWIVEQDGRYQVTEEGRQLRQAAEDKTEELFTICCSGLSAEELGELKRLLAELRDALKQQSLELAQ